MLRSYIDFPSRLEVVSALDQLPACWTRRRRVKLSEPESRSRGVPDNQGRWPVNSRCLLAAALAISLAAVSLAHSQGVVVLGALDCGKWVQARTNSASSNLEHYLLGLLNGLALGRQVEFWQARGLPSPSRESVYLWMDGYCRDNPLNDVAQGATALYAERSGWQE